MALGAYPYVPALVAARRRKKSLLRRSVSLDLPIEWGLGIASSLVRPLGFAPLPGYDVRGPRPVILAHGYAMGRSCFWPMAARLAASGVGPTVGFEYWTLGGVAEGARRLGRLVERVLESTGADAVDIVGHSMGGVVSRYYTNLEAGGDRVRRLITLGSPHSGAEISLFGVGRMRTELRRGSPTLTRLAASKTPDNVALTCIWSPIDVLVSSERHTKIDGAEVIRIDRVGHIGLLTNPIVTELVLQRLNSSSGLDARSE